MKSVTEVRLLHAHAVRENAPSEQRLRLQHVHTLEPDYLRDSTGRERWPDAGGQPPKHAMHKDHVMHALFAEGRRTIPPPATLRPTTPGSGNFRLLVQGRDEAEKLSRPMCASYSKP